MKLGARSVALALVLCGLPTSAVADPFYCADADERAVAYHVLQPDKVLVIERCTTSAGHAYTQERVNVSVWRGSDRLFAQTLQPGMMVTDSGSEWRVSSRGRAITWHRFCGSVYEDEPGPFCDDLWTFDERHGRFLTAEERGALATFERLVASKRLDLGRVEAALSKLERESFTVDVDWSLRLRLKVAERLEGDAESALEAGDRARAGELAASAFTWLRRPPWLTKHPEDLGALEAQDVLWLEVGSSKALEALVPLPRAEGDASVRLANDVGYLLEQTDLAEAAVELLEPLVAAVPDRGVARLNLADALWKTGRREESRPHYERYADWRRSLGEPIPPRVDERIGRGPSSKAM